MALDRPYDDGRVQTANVGISSCTMSENIIDDLCSNSSQNELYISDIGDYTRQQRTVVLSSEGGRPQSFTQAAPNELKLGKGG